MEHLYSIMKRTIIIIVGFVWGCISFFWLGYSILTLGNVIEEPGSIDYEAEGEAVRIYGLIGCMLYVITFLPILFSLYKQKKYLLVFLLSMILGGMISGIYICN